MQWGRSEAEQQSEWERKAEGKVLHCWSRMTLIDSSWREADSHVWACCWLKGRTWLTIVGQWSVTASLLKNPQVFTPCRTERNFFWTDSAGLISSSQAWFHHMSCFSLPQAWAFSPRLSPACLFMLFFLHLTFRVFSLRPARKIKPYSAWPGLGNNVKQMQCSTVNRSSRSGIQVWCTHAP